MTGEDWMGTSYQQLKEAAHKITSGHELADELLHYCLDEVLRKPNIQEIIDSGGATFYTVRVMMTQWKSSTSPFYRIYRRPASDVDDYSYMLETEPEYTEEELQETVAKISKELEQLHWYDQNLFKIYLEENHSMSSLSRATGIPRTSISLTINRIRKHIKNKIK